MKKIFLIASGFIPEDWSPVLEELYDTDPDEIILLSNTEVNLLGNWGALLDPLQNWLESKNKFATFVTPHLDNIYIRKNIQTEQSYAMLESVYPLFLDFPKLDFNFDRYYCSYMYRPDEARGRLLDTLISNNLLDYGYVTYHNPQVRTHDTFKHWNESPLLFDQENYSKDSNLNFIKPIFYENSFVDIVAEASTEHFFITEKTLRAIFHRKLFLTIGPRYFYRDYLVKFFKCALYDDIFDYSFDEESDLQKRINGIVSNIEKIKDMTCDNLMSAYNDLKFKLDYNRSTLVSIYNNPYKLVPRCLHKLFDNKYEHQFYGLHQVSLIDYIRKYKKWLTFTEIQNRS
jgi:hypothetical protein